MKKGKKGVVLGVLLAVFGVLIGIFALDAQTRYSSTATYYLSRQGFGVAPNMVNTSQTGTIYDIPAARDSAETANQLIQYGAFTLVTAIDTIKFSSEGLSAFSSAPKVISLFRVGALAADTVFAVHALKVTADTLILAMTAQDTMGKRALVARGTVHYGLIGPR